MPVPIILPKFGFTLESSTIVQWLKNEGDAVRAGDPICEVTTDKVNMEIEAPEAGTLYGFRYAVGDDVPVTEIICYLARAGETPEVSPTLPASAVSVTATTDAAAEPPTPNPELPVLTPATPIAQRVAANHNVDLAAISGTGPNGRIMRRDVETALQAAPLDPVGKVRATPAARHLAAQNGIALNSITGSGPRGRVQSADVKAAVNQQAVALATAVPSTPAAITVHSPALRTFKLTGMRRTIALRLQKSFQTAPHIFVETSIDASGIEGLRRRLKTQHEKLSVTALLVRACAHVLMKHPAVNATINEDEVTLWGTANVGIAVALEDGLVVPVIHNAEQLSLSTTQHKLEALTERARTNTLHINDVTDGTFTISNMGMYGVDRFTAIINPPQVAILAVGRTQKLFVPDENDQPVLRSIINLVLSADHRVIDGATAARFLAQLKQVLEEPALLVW